MFKYENEENNKARRAYDDIKVRLKELGVTIATEELPSRDKMPLIIALDPRTSINPEIVSKSLEETLTAAKILNKNTGGEGAYGAYLGGAQTISGINLIGASDVHVYLPKYRKLTENELHAMDSELSKSKN